MKNKEKKPEHVNVKSIDEAVNYLLEHVSKESLKDVKRSKNTIEFHHGFGTWIRNTFGLWHAPSGLKDQMINQGITHPDDMSSVILKQLQKKLRETL